jgi:hypothetical protein
LLLSGIFLSIHTCHSGGNYLVACSIFPLNDIFEGYKRGIKNPRNPLNPRESAIQNNQESCAGQGPRSSFDLS